MYSTSAIILKRTDSGEADALFTLYTKEHGKILARAQGVKKEGAKLKGHLEPLNLCSVSFVLGKSGERLTHASLINYWPVIRGDLERLESAFGIAEMVDLNFLPGQKDEAAWDEILGSLKYLENSENGGDPAFLSSFQKRLSVSLGYGAESGIMNL